MYGTLIATVWSLAGIDGLEDGGHAAASDQLGQLVLIELFANIDFAHEIAPLPVGAWARTLTLARRPDQSDATLAAAREQVLQTPDQTGGRPDFRVSRPAA